MSVLPHEGGDYPVLWGTYEVPSGSSYRVGFAARPDRLGQFPAVIVLPRRDGVTTHTKSLSWQLARRGFSVLVIDPYRGSAGTSDRLALADLSDAIAFVGSDDTDWFTPGAVGLLGIADGGRYALLHAADRDDAGAVAVAYTRLTGDEAGDIGEVLRRITVPVLGLYGQQDPTIGAADVDRAQTLNSAGQWIVYEGVGHDFLDEESDTYHDGATYDSISRLAALFAAYLPAPQELVRP